METIANLSVAAILYFVVILTGLRIVLIRVPTPPARAIAEIVESGLIAIVLVFLLIRPFAIQAYFIPSPSMEPTLLGKNGSGDRILVNKFQYRLGGSHAPKHGDIVVFIPPKEATQGKLEETNGAPVNFIKRLMGLPGDTMQAVHGDVVVNDARFSHSLVRSKLLQANFYGTDTERDLQADHHLKFTTAGVLSDGKLIPNPQLADMLAGDTHATVKMEPGYVIRNGEKLPDSYTAEDPDYDMQIYHGQPLKWMPQPNEPGDSYRLNGQEIAKEDYYRMVKERPEAIPAGHYFMMGDNRNDSEDSTEWGPLDSTKVVGKAQFIFWPPNRVGAIH